MLSAAQSHATVRVNWFSAALLMAYNAPVLIAVGPPATCWMPTFCLLSQAINQPGFAHLRCGLEDAEGRRKAAGAERASHRGVHDDAAAA